MVESDSQIQILDSRNFLDLEELRRAREDIDKPCLLVLSATQAAEALAWLRQTDDLVLREGSPELITHRKQRLQSSLTGKLDPLTNCLNRQSVESALQEVLNHASAGRPVSVVLCDIDYFKTINDRFGHNLGDEVLKMVGRVLLQHAEGMHRVGRLGGEEFVIIVQMGSEVIELAETIRQSVASYEIRGVQATISCGVATTLTACDKSYLIGRANEALYAAKAEGRNRSVSFQELEARSAEQGADVAMQSLQTQARVLTERVTNFITLRSQRLVDIARREAEIDALTECFNRRYLDRQLAREFEGRTEALTIAFIDLDFFGQVNKEHGWPTGDKILRDICETIREEIRKHDWLCRYGGEEFCVVMPGTGVEEAQGVLERLCRKVAATDYFAVTGKRVPMTLSIGGAMAATQDGDVAQLVSRASENALLAKRNGRNCVYVESERLG